MIGVYVARDAGGTVLYVGSSADIDKRLGQHRARSTRAVWWATVDSVEQIPVETRFLARDLERQMIVDLKPLHNIMSQGGATKTTKVRGPVVVPRTLMLARIIEEHGNVANLAAAVGLNHMTMSNIWRGVCYPSSKAIARLMIVTGLEFDQLFHVEITDGATSPSDWSDARAPRKPRAVAAPKAVA